jgi:hypothetical protein
MLRRVSGRAFAFDFDFDFDFERQVRLLLRMALERGDGDVRGRLCTAEGAERVRDRLGLAQAAGRDRELRLERLALLFLEELFRLEERLLAKDRPRDGLDPRNAPRDPPLRVRLADGRPRASESPPAWAGTVGTSSARAAKRRTNR